jgi:hypothetical protein
MYFNVSRTRGEPSTVFPKLKNSRVGSGGPSFSTPDFEHEKAEIAIHPIQKKTIEFESIFVLLFERFGFIIQASS